MVELQITWEMLKTTKIKYGIKYTSTLCTHTHFITFIIVTGSSAFAI